MIIAVAVFMVFVLPVITGVIVGIVKYAAAASRERKANKAWMPALHAHAAHLREGK